MKLIIAGSRTLFPTSTFLEACISEAGLKPNEIISGCADGVDASAIELTKQRLGLSYLSKKLFGKLLEFPADWEKFGNAAGPVRNKQMAEEGDALLLIWDGESKGSANMKKEMLFKKKPVYEVILKSHNVEKL